MAYKDIYGDISSQRKQVEKYQKEVEQRKKEAKEFQEKSREALKRIERERLKMTPGEQLQASKELREIKGKREQAQEAVKELEKQKGVAKEALGKLEEQKKEIEKYEKEGYSVTKTPEGKLSFSKPVVRTRAVRQVVQQPQSATPQVIQQKQAEMDRLNKAISATNQNLNAVNAQINILSKARDLPPQMKEHLKRLRIIKTGLEASRNSLMNQYSNLKSDLGRQELPPEQRVESYAEEYETKVKELEDIKFTESISAPDASGKKLTEDYLRKKRELEKWFDTTGKYTPEQYSIVTQLQEVGVTEDKFQKEGFTLPRFTHSEYKDLSFKGVSFDPKKQTYEDVVKTIAQRNQEIGLAIAKKDYEVKGVPQKFSELVTLPQNYRDMGVPEKEYEDIAYRYNVLNTVSDKDFFDWRTQKGVKYYQETGNFPFFFKPEAYSSPEGSGIPEQQWDKLAFESVFMDLPEDEKKKRLSEFLLPEWKDTYSKNATDAPTSFKIIFQKPNTDEWKDYSESEYDKIKYHQIVGGVDLDTAIKRTKENVPLSAENLVFTRVITQEKGEAPQVYTGGIKPVGEAEKGIVTGTRQTGYAEGTTAREEQLDIPTFARGDAWDTSPGIALKYPSGKKGVLSVVTGGQAGATTAELKKYFIGKSSTGESIYLPETKEHLYAGITPGADQSKTILKDLNKDIERVTDSLGDTRNYLKTVDENIGKIRDSDIDKWMLDIDEDGKDDEVSKKQALDYFKGKKQEVLQSREELEQNLKAIKEQKAMISRATGIGYGVKKTTGGKWEFITPSTDESYEALYGKDHFPQLVWHSLWHGDLFIEPALANIASAVTGDPGYAKAQLQETKAEAVASELRLRKYGQFGGQRWAGELGEIGASPGGQTIALAVVTYGLSSAVGAGAKAVKSAKIGSKVGTYVAGKAPTVYKVGTKIAPTAIKVTKFGAKPVMYGALIGYEAGQLGKMYQQDKYAFPGRAGTHLLRLGAGAYAFQKGFALGYGKPITPTVKAPKQTVTAKPFSTTVKQGLGSFKETVSGHLWAKYPKMTGRLYSGAGRISDYGRGLGYSARAGIKDIGYKTQKLAFGLRQRPTFRTTAGRIGDIGRTVKFRVGATKWDVYGAKTKLTAFKRMPKKDLIPIKKVEKLMTPKMYKKYYDVRLKWRAKFPKKGLYKTGEITELPYSTAEAQTATPSFPWQRIKARPWELIKTMPKGKAPEPGFSFAGVPKGKPWSIEKQFQYAKKHGRGMFREGQIKDVTKPIEGDEWKWLDTYTRKVPEIKQTGKYLMGVKTETGEAMKWRLASGKEWESAFKRVDVTKRVPKFEEFRYKSTRDILYDPKTGEAIPLAKDLPIKRVDVSRYAHLADPETKINYGITTKLGEPKTVDVFGIKRYHLPGEGVIKIAGKERVVKPTKFVFQDPYVSAGAEPVKAITLTKTKAIVKPIISKSVGKKVSTTIAKDIGDITKYEWYQAPAKQITYATGQKIRGLPDAYAMAYGGVSLETLEFLEEGTGYIHPRWGRKYVEIPGVGKIETEERLGVMGAVDAIPKGELGVVSIGAIKTEDLYKEKPEVKYAMITGELFKTDTGIRTDVGRGTIQTQDIDMTQKMMVGQMTALQLKQQQLLKQKLLMKYKLSAIKSPSFEPTKPAQPTPDRPRPSEPVTPPPIIPEAPLPFARLQSQVPEGKKKMKRKVKFRFQKTKKRAEPIVLAQPFKVMESQIKYGVATHPETTSKLLKKGIKEGWDIPTVELMEEKKGIRKPKKKKYNWKLGKNVKTSVRKNKK